MPQWTTEAQHVAFTNETVARANKETIQRSQRQVVKIEAYHDVLQKQAETDRETNIENIRCLYRNATNPRPQHDKIVPPSIELAIGVPVMLTFNAEQSAGLCNGTRGIVYDIMVRPSSKIPIVLVQIKQKYVGPSFVEGVPAVVPIAPKQISWTTSEEASQYRTSRYGLPLRLAYAMTIHKVQGLTCDKLVFHSEKVPSIALAYVALSRVRTRDAILLTSRLSMQHLTSSKAEKTAFKLESERVAQRAQATRNKAQDVVVVMKEVARRHNSAFVAR